MATRTHPVPERERAIDACDVLNDFIGDLITGVMVFRDYVSSHQQGKTRLEMMVSVQKMCMSNIVLGLTKFEEFWVNFHDLVPEDHRSSCKAILRRMNQRKIGNFRDTYVGHIIDLKTKCPLKKSDVEAAFRVIAEPGIDEFLRWINDPKSNAHRDSVVSVVEAVRDTLQQAYGITPDEIINR